MNIEISRMRGRSGFGKRVAMVFLQNKKNSKLRCLGSIQGCGNGNEKLRRHFSRSPFSIQSCGRRQPTLRMLEALHALMKIQILVKLGRVIKSQGKVEVVGCLGDTGTWKSFKSWGRIRDWDRLRHTERGGGLEEVKGCLGV